MTLGQAVEGQPATAHIVRIRRFEGKLLRSGTRITSSSPSPAPLASTRASGSARAERRRAATNALRPGPPSRSPAPPRKGTAGRPAGALGRILLPLMIANDADPRGGAGGVRSAARGPGGRARRAAGGRGARAAGGLRRLPHGSLHGLGRRPVRVCARPCSGTRARAWSSGSGEGARLVQPGDHVVTLFSPQCGECVHCRSPRTNLCLAIREQQNLGYLPDGTTRLSRDGEPIRHFMGTSTFAEYAVLPEIALAKVSPEAPLDRACLFACGLSTGLGAAMFTAKVEPGRDLRRVRRRDGRPRRRRGLPAPGRRADRVRRPVRGAARAGHGPGRDRRPARPAPARWSRSSR